MKSLMRLEWGKNMKMNIKDLMFFAIMITSSNSYAEVTVTLPCTEGITSKNRTTIAKVQKIEIDIKNQKAFIFGSRFLVANPNTGNQSIEKRSLGIIALSLDPSAENTALVQECLNLAKQALAKSAGFSIASATEPGVIVGPANIIGHPELKSTHCLALAGKYLASPTEADWGVDVMSAPQACAILTTGSQIMGGAGSAAVDVSH